MKKLLLVTLLSLSPIVATLSINCAQTTQQAQETILRAECREIRIIIESRYGPAVATSRSGARKLMLREIVAYQSEYLRSIGTPVAQKLLAEMGPDGL